MTVRLALEVDREEKPDVLLVLLPGIDRISHYMWAGVEPVEAYDLDRRQDPPDRAQKLRIMRRYYSYTDQLIGLLIDRFEPGDLVLVLSDHGFHAFRDKDDPGLTGGHVTTAGEHGVIFARGPGVPAGHRIRGLVVDEDTPAMTINDVTPTVLAWLGLPVARDMDGSPAPFLDVTSPGVIDTYDRSPIERVETTAEDLEDELLERLRSLGYLQ